MPIARIEKESLLRLSAVKKSAVVLWQTKEGQNRIYHFSISDGKTLYELSFDTSSLLWRIEKLEV